MSLPEVGHERLLDLRFAGACGCRGKSATPQEIREPSPGEYEMCGDHKAQGLDGFDCAKLEGLYVARRPGTHVPESQADLTTEYGGERRLCRLVSKAGSRGFEPFRPRASTIE